jgi:hypothetical protein
VKINSSSYQVLKKKAERDIRAVLGYLESNATTPTSTTDSAASNNNGNGEIGYDAIRKGSQLLLKHRQLKTEQLEHVTMQVFNLLDFNRTGFIPHSHFVSISIPLLFHQTMHAALTDIRSAFRDLSRPTNQEEDDQSVGRGKFSASPDELQTLKNWLTQLAVAVQTRLAVAPAPPSAVTNPKINEYSLKLAARKEKKEKQQLVTMLNSDSQHRRRVDERTDGSEHDHADDRTVMFDEATTISRMIPMSGPRVNPVHQQRDVAQSSSGATPTYQETLEIRQKLSQLKRQQLVEQVTADRTSECTFRPKLPTKSIAVANNRSRLNVNDLNNSFDSNTIEQPERPSQQYTNSNSHTTSTAAAQDDKQNTNMDTIYNRLYLQKRDLRPTSSSDVSSYIIDELKYCTFAPVLATKESYVPANSLNNSGAHAASTRSIEGYDKSVNRIRNVQEKQQRQKEADATAHLTLDEKYKQSRVVAKQGAAPFNFKLQERRAEQMHQQKAPRLMIDVKLSATRTAKIPISDFDTPSVLAVKFAKIYSLDVNMRNILAAVIAQSMVKNGIPMTVEPGPDDDSATRDDDDQSRSDESEGSNADEEEEEEEDEAADDSTLDTNSVVHEDPDRDLGTADTSETDTTPRVLSPAAAAAANMNEGYMRHKMQMQQQHSKMLSGGNRNSPFNIMGATMVEDIGELSDD